MIREGESGPIKIGRSNDPWRRLDTLQAGNARQLLLIAAYRVGKTAHVVERNTHREFIAHRMIGEWYAPVDRLVDLAASHGLPCCERCSAKELRLHVWQGGSYGTEPPALCFRCMNNAEEMRIREKEASDARARADNEARFAARQTERRN